MAIFDSDDTIQRWKYIIKYMKFNIPDQAPFDIPVERINRITIEENFEEHYFPLIKVTLVLDSDTYYNILSNKNNCKINMRIDRFYFKNETNEKSISKSFINDMFELILDEGTDDMYRSLKEDENKLDYTKKIKDKTNELDEVINELSFYLFKSVISGTKKNVNKVLCECNVSDAIAYLATVSDVNNILMGQPDNQKIYKEFLIPPLSILRALEFIDYYYGIFKDGTMIYFGIDYNYILPYNGKCVANYTNEITVTNIIIPKSTNLTHQNLLGSMKKTSDPNKNYIVADYSSINIENQSISNDYINANNLQAIDSYDEISSVGKSKAISKDSSFTKIMENKTMNEYFATMYAAQSNAKSVVVSLRLRDYDIRAIAPNKEFNLIFEDINYTRKYNGKYILAGISHDLGKESNYLFINSTIVLRKV